MGNLLNPFRLPTVQNDSRFIAPLWNPLGDLYYNKTIADIPASFTSSETANKFACGTFVHKATGVSTSWAKFLSLHGPLNTTDDGVFYMGYHVTNDQLYWAVKNPGNVLIASGIFFSGTVSDGTVRRVAFRIDIGNQIAEVSINGGAWTSMISLNWSLDSNIRWNEIQHGGNATVNEHWGSCFAAGDGFGMVSLDNSFDIDKDKVFDGSGYFTNPGYQFKNWYGHQPMVGWINAPHVNQGRFWWLSGKNYNHNPAQTWDYVSTSESRHFKTLRAPGSGTDVNEGVTY